jgi:hypothetical protein
VDIALAEALTLVLRDLENAGSVIPASANISGPAPRDR